MAGNRAAAEKLILTYVEKMLPGGGNDKHYKDLFASMDDVQFESFMKQLKSGEKKLCIIAPNQSPHRLDVARNFEVARELGHNFFERIWMDGKAGSNQFLSTQPYLVVDLPICRQAQLLIKKISIPEDSSSVDNLTGQPTGSSKGSKISYPELQILASQDLVQCTTELIKYRGGDVQGFLAMNDSISKTGQVHLSAIEGQASGVKSTKTLEVYLKSMHLDNTLGA